MNNISKTFQSEDIFNTKGQHQPSHRMSNTFKSDLPIYDNDQKYPKRDRKQKNGVYQPNYNIPKPKTMHDNEFYGIESVQKGMLYNKENGIKIVQNDTDQYCNKKQYFNQFSSSNIFHQQQPCFDSFDKRNGEKQIEKDIQRVIANENQKDFNKLMNIHKRVIDSQKSQIEDLKGYQNIEKTINDDYNIEMKKQNHHYSHMFELESNPQKVNKVEAVFKNPDTFAWYKVDSIQTENQLKQYKEKQQLSHRKKKQYDLQGTHNFFDSVDKREQLDIQNKSCVELQKQKSDNNKLDGNDSKSRFYQHFHNSSIIEQPKSYNHINNGEMKVVEFKMNGNLQDETIFIKKCQQNGVHFLNYEQSIPNQRLLINNGKFKIRVNGTNNEQIDKIQKLLNNEGLKANQYNQNMNRKNKKLQECSNVEWTDQRIVQELCTNDKPELDCYTRKVNNLQVSENQTSKHIKQQVDRSEVHHPESLMVMHDYYRKVNNLQRKLDKMNKQQKQRK